MTLSGYPNGLQFDYSVWTQHTVIDLTNVPWGNDYRFGVRWTVDQLNAYIDGNATTNVRLANMRYARFDEPIKVQVPFWKVQNYNYVRVANPLQPGVDNDVQRNAYYFITGARHVTPDVTEITIQLDVFQTFQAFVQFGDVFLDRGHWGMANTNRFSNYGRDWLTIPEGQDLGSSYRITKVVNDEVMGIETTVDTSDERGDFDRNNYDILIATSTNPEADPGSVTNPNLNPAKGSQIGGMASGASMYLFKGAQNFQRWVLNQQAWIAKGVQNITIIPRIDRYIPGYAYVPGHQPTIVVPGSPIPAGDYGSPYHVPPGALPPRKTSMLADWRNNADIRGQIPARYRNLDKLFTAPYMYIEMTTYMGTPIMIAPEAWNDADATIVEMINIVPPAQRVVFYPHKYNSPFTGALDPLDDDWGDALDNSTMITSFPTLAIMNDSGVAYLASNAHGIAYSFSSADYSQQKALRGAKADYDNTRVGMQAGTDITSSNIDAANQQLPYKQLSGEAGAFVSGVGGASGSAVGGAIAGGPAGAAAGAGLAVLGTGFGVAGARLQSGIMAQQNIIANQQARTNTNIGNAATQQIADTNLGLASWAANGDYANAVQGINAKLQDAQLLPPGVVGQVGGDAFNLVNGRSIVSLRWKMIDNAAISRIGEIWLRYGYPVNRYIRMPDSWMTHDKLTYWKLTEANIFANMPEQYKQAFRGMFEKGITLVSDPSYIGNIDLATNNALPGITG